MDGLDVPPPAYSCGHRADYGLAAEPCRSLELLAKSSCYFATLFAESVERKIRFPTSDAAQRFRDGGTGPNVSILEIAFRPVVDQWLTIASA